MKLTRRHIGKIFDVRGSDGSWAYLLLDVKNKELLFYTLGSGRFEIESTRHNDWRPFEPQIMVDKERIEQEWKTARRAP